MKSKEIESKAIENKSEFKNEFSLCKACAKRQASRIGVKLVHNEQCYLCKGIFDRLGGIAERVATKLETTDAEYYTFLIGTRLPKDMATREEELWENLGLSKECLKTELNRELGKLIETNYKKYRYDPDPDVKAIYDIRSGIIDIELTSLFIFGKYNKLKRGVRQTIRAGSDEESVEEFITPSFVAAARAEKAYFHGHGREDIDVLMLGKGRPFIVEVVGPRVRKLNLSKLTHEINEKAKGKVEVRDLKYTKSSMVANIKNAKFDKNYKALVELSTPIKENDLEKILSHCLLLQRTPLRVLNRRADLVRKRRVREIKAKFVNKKHDLIELTMTTESGTYVKEFISGDEGRTEPSITSMLGITAKCKELNVLRIHSEWYEDFW